jgi:hypothetical protein
MTLNNNLISSYKIKSEKDLKDNLNLKYLDLINQTYCVGKYDMPTILSPNYVYIDYLALYSDRFEYKKLKTHVFVFMNMIKCLIIYMVYLMRFIIVK